MPEPPRGETVTEALLNKRLLAAVTCQAPHCEEAWHFLSSGSPVTDRDRHVCCLSSVSLCYLPVSPSHHPVPGWRWEPFPFLGRWVTTSFPRLVGYHMHWFSCLAGVRFPTSCNDWTTISAPLELLSGFTSYCLLNGCLYYLLF